MAHWQSEMHRQGLRPEAVILSSPEPLCDLAWPRPSVMLQVYPKEWNKIPGVTLIS